METPQLKDKYSAYSPNGIPVVDRKYSAFTPDITGFRVYNEWFKHARKKEIAPNPRLHALIMDHHGYALCSIPKKVNFIHMLRSKVFDDILVEFRKSATWRNNAKKKKFLKSENSVQQEASKMNLSSNSINYPQNWVKVSKIILMRLLFLMLDK